MKNLKKVLALVLVVATLMGLATVAGAAFTDAGSIEYKEAVDVMEMIGVINGYTDGSFRPEGNIKRAEMAKMVAYIVSGGEDVGALYAGANSFSDCTTHWAKGYIAYANKTGIVAGVGGGKFNPEGSVTGTQVAKMMLCALGYDAAIEEYTGPNWSVNVLSDARDAGLLKGLSGVDMSKAMTREQAAQLMLNALKADVVKYSNKGTSIDLGNGVIINPSASDPEPVENTETDYMSANGKYVDGTSDKRLQLCEKYFEDLLLAEGEDDAFGRTGNQWLYTKGAETDVYGATADYVVVVDKADDTVADWAKEANKKMTFVTGEKATEFHGNGVAVTNSASVLGIGDTVEFFVDSDNNITNVVVTRYTADVITDVDTDVKDADAEDGVSAYITFDKAGTFNDTDIAGYNSKTYVKDAVVAMVEGAGDYKDEIIGSYVAKSVEGSITAYTATTYTMDGTKYTVAADADDAISSVDFKEGSYKLYLDNNGYVIKTEVVEGTANISDVFYVASNWETTDNAYGKVTTYYYVQAVYMDGTIEEIEVAKVTDSAGANSTLAGNVKSYVDGLANDLCTTEKTAIKDSDKKADVKLAAWDIADTDYSYDTTVAVTEIKADSTKADDLYLGKDTVYVVVEGEGADLKTTVKTGSLSYKYTTGDAVSAIYTVENRSKVANYVIIVTDEFSAAETGDYIYVAADTKGSFVNGGYAYSVYNMDGKAVEIVEKDATKVPASGFYTYSVDEDGLYELSARITDKTVDYTAAYSNYYGTLLTTSAFTDYDTADAVIVDVHDTDDYNKSITTLAAMQNAFKAGYVVTLDVVVNDNDKTVDAIFVAGSTAGAGAKAERQPGSRDGFMDWFATETDAGAKAWGNLPTIGIEQSVAGNTISLSGKVDNLLAGTLSEGVLAGVNYRYFNNVTDADSLKTAIEAMSGTNGEVESVSKAGFVGVNVDGVACVACVFEGTVKDAKSETHNGTFVVSQTKGYTDGVFGFNAKGLDVTVNVSGLSF